MRRNSKRFGPNVLRATFLLLIAFRGNTFAAETSATPETFRAALHAADDITDQRIQVLQKAGVTHVVVLLDGNSTEQTVSQRRAAERVLASELKLYYWIEIARCPELADEHPEWMASLQVHDEWRRLFPDVPQPDADEVAKTYPWVPILSREPFAAQLKRVQRLLAERPAPDGVFLNDLQGAPSACGCGNALCRWTSDYGERRTTTPLADDAATLFVAAVQETIPDATIVPVWTTECERHDGADDGQCAGVGCFDGICWKAYTKQLMPLQQTSPTLGVLATYRQFERDLPVYGERAGWVRNVVESFQKMPPLRDGKSIPASRLITVLQGWDVDADDIAAQIEMSKTSGAMGYVVAYTKLEQSWRPVVVRWK